VIDSAAALQAIRTPVGEPAPMSGVKRLRQLLALERHDVWSLAWYSGGVGLLSLAVPVAAQALVNTVAFTALGQPVIALAVLVLIGLALAALLRTLRLQTIERFEQRLFVRATHDAAVRLTRARLSAFAERGAPELMNRFFDVVTIQKASSILLVDGLSVVLQGTVSLLLLAFYHPALLAFDVLLIGSILFVVFGLGRGGMETAIKESKVKYNVAAWLEEIASSFRAFKSTSADDLAFRRADALAAEYVHARKKHFRVLLRQTIGSYVIQIFATAGLLGLGGFLVIGGELTLGQLVAAELIVTSVTAGLTYIGKYLESFYDLVASVDKLGAIVDLAEENYAGLDPGPGSGGGASLRFEGVSFRHSDGTDALTGVSFSVEPSRQLAILGRDTSGKSTLADLVFALRYATAGRIRIDGLDARDYALRELRAKVALVSGPEVFDGTVLDNVLMGATLDHADVTGALKAAALDTDVAALSNGLSSTLGHAGSKLTSSQVARLMIARALVRRPKLLVLDESLDGLGMPTIDQILSELRRYTPELSLLVLTSREDIALRVGSVAFLENGKLTATEGQS
jgi:ABC-type bacteriocin/lantibiotic exporter with double-glycine peptidase domain